VKLNKPFLQSVRGQLLLFGVVYAGAAGIAFGVLPFRPWFEQWIRHKHLKPTELDRQLFDRLASDPLTNEDSEKLRRLTDEETAVLYGIWLDSPGRDPNGLAGTRLLSDKAKSILSLVKFTFVAGSPAQSARAAGLLGEFDDPERLRDASELAAWLAERARRRGDGDTERAARSALERLKSAIARRQE
jgi:hypothetical protein